jgi:hypothetical protein
VKKLILLFALFGLFTKLFANPVDDSTAKLVGKNFLLYKSNSNVFTTIGNLTLTYKATDSTNTRVLFYVFNIDNPKGFVIVSGDDNVKPILGYSDKANFLVDQMPIQLTEWFDGYKKDIDYAVKNKLNNSDITAQWQTLIKPQTRQTIELFGITTFGTPVVSPLITTIWNQTKYYDNLCPYDTQSGVNTVTGCVATVMAQVMKYWKYPTKGIGTRTYTPKTNPQYGSLTANFGNTTYLWDSMPTALTAASTANQVKAVANLMYHCGVSVDMDYSTTNSVAYTTGGLYFQSADYALEAYFGYDNNLQAIQRSNFTSAKWIDTIQKELKAGRPVIYRGTGSGGGHSFIADGYDNNNYLHFNWGWGGINDGYYQIDSLNPKILGTGGGSGGYNNYQFAIIGIKPSASTVYGIGLNANLSLSATNIEFNSAVAVTTSLTNVGTTTFTGDFALAAFDASNNFVDFIKTIPSNTVKSGASTSTLNFSTTGNLSLLPGTYELAVYYKPTGGNWTLVNNNSTYNNYIFLTVNTVIPKTTNLTFTGCKSVVYNSKTYLSSTVVTDTLKAVQGWDSLYIVANINIKPITPTTKSVAYTGCSSVVYKSITYTKSTVIRDTVRSFQGCDSIYNVANITIKPITPTTNSVAYAGCSSVVYKSITYTKSSVIRDTVRSFQGCDSIYNVANITIKPIAPTTNSVAYAGCSSVVYKSITYTKSTVIRDTIKSYQGCDSIYNVANITVTIPVSPSVTVSATKTTIITGDSITFTASPINGGTSPVYQWKKNGVIISGATSATYTTPLLANNDTITCQVTSNLSCVTTSVAVSNKVVVKVLSLLSIGGNISTPSGTPISKVSVVLNGNKSLFSGSYNLNAPSNSNYVLKASKNNDSLKANGVSVIDVYLVQSHILGKQLLNSPYKIIAADVNNDGLVSVSDLLLMKRLILGMDTTFTGNRLWAFVDSAYQFANSANPFPFKDSILINNLLINQSKQNFIGVKLGDVNYDWQSTIAGTDNKPNSTVHLYYPSMSTAISNQNEIRLPIKVSDFKNLIGLQFTMNYNSKNLDLVGIENNVLGIEYGIAHREKGKISFLWNDKNMLSQTLEDSTTLMELVFKKTSNTNTDSLAITADITPIEAWDINYQKHPIALSAITKQPIPTPTITTESWAIVPNPSDGLLKIKLSIKENKDIQFYLTTVEGRLLNLKKVSALKGNTTISLNLNDKGKLASGIYYLKAVGLDAHDTKKVVIR